MKYRWIFVKATNIIQSREVSLFCRLINIMTETKAGILDCCHFKT